jgi:predicted nuclease of predicted toxin-antitoxin system
VLDEDVDAGLVHVLTVARHNCWTVLNAGMSSASDDDVAIYAHNKNAVLVSHDRGFARRRRTNYFGQHIHLRCPEPDAIRIIQENLDEIVRLLSRGQDMVLRVTSESITVLHPTRD